LKAGWLFTKLPFTSQSWKVEFTWHVHGHGSTLSGDGFAFWYTKDKAEVGPVFGNKDKFDGLGIFFDTYANGNARSQFPYVMAMVGDGKTSYDLAQDGQGNEKGGCYSEVRDHDDAKAKITYLREVDGGTLTLELDVRSDEEWRQCFSIKNVQLPTAGYLGFSALTGDITDAHDILRVDTQGIIMVF
jgi:mannose-binding lectin 2